MMRKSIPQWMLSLVALPFVTLLAGCTEPQCYREHLHVYTKDYVAICEDGYWKDYCNPNRSDTAGCPSQKYVFSDCEKNDIIPKLDDLKCPVIQCVDNECSCGPSITRSEIGVQQAIDLIEESTKL